MAEVIDEAVRREQALQLERIRLALRKAARGSQVDSATVLAWKQLRVTDHAIAQVRKILSNVALTVLSETKGQILRPDLLAALGTVKDAVSAAPTMALPSATCKLLLASLGPGTAATTCDLYDAGFGVVPADIIPSIRCLAAKEPQLADVEVLQTSWGVEWRLFADVTLINLGHAPLKPEQLTAMLWNPKDLVDPSQSGLHRWVAFLHAYELILQHDPKTACAQLNLFGAASHLMTPIEKEVVNLYSYLMLLTSGDERIGDAIALLNRIRRSPTARKNWELLKSRSNTTRNQRDSVENPYLALGVRHGAPKETWRSAWMAIRSARRDDLDAISAANEARDRIIELEKEELDGLGRVYVTPLDSRFIVSLPEGNEPTSSQRDSSLEVLRLAALHEFLCFTP